MTVNEKFKSTYVNRFKCFLFMGTNKPVKITDAKSGLIRRLILQRTIDIFEVDVNAYEPYVKDINREIELIKKWRQKDNQIKTHLKG